MKWRRSPPLKNAGIVTELIVLPSMLVEECPYNDPSCLLKARRAAAARVGADALLTITEATAVDEYANVSAILDLTIAGIWLVPGHHRDALTVAEGAMIDNRNEYLYVFARGEAEEHLVRPFASWKAARPSRLRALRAFGQEFIRQASELRNK
ncbi:MAG: hypothetical protein AB1428_15085 [Bacteroidota bacterium]